MKLELPQDVRACGALAGLRMPKVGPLPGVPVQWMTGPLGDHGTIDCPAETCLKTGPDGVARLAFTPSTEPEMPALGPEEYDRALVASQVNYPLALGNAWGYVPLAGGWEFRDVRIGWHVPEPSYEISGSHPSEPRGLRFTGRACSLDEPFEVKTKGDLIGKLTFRPDGDQAGTWTYKGKPFNAALKVVGSGSYSAAVSEDRSTGTIDTDGSMTIRIPVVGDQTRPAVFSLTLTGAPPCAD